MTTPLFSTYSQPENRVTSTLLAVLQRLSLPNIDRILGALLEETSFSLVTFDNQPKGQTSTPDAKIGTGKTVWIETKIRRNKVELGQIKEHLKNLQAGQNLLLLTPDDCKPKGLPGRVVWSNFRSLSEVIGHILNDEDDENEPPSEKEAFLLREFISMLKQEKLLSTTEPGVMVVAAREAWPMYEPLSAYRCSLTKPMRSDCDHMAFYKDGEIKPLVPRIKFVIESIDVMQDEKVAGLGNPGKELAEELREKIKHHNREHQFDQAFKVMFLSGPDDDETVKLTEPIENDKTDKNDKPVPFTYGTRYVTLESLKEARKTSELKLC